MRLTAMPYYLGTSKDNQNIYNHYYAPANAFDQISYIVMLEMDRNRKFIRYEQINDETYF
jgi:hypothetical protein